MNKNNIYGKWLAPLFLTVFLFSCNDDFMERAPKDRIVGENFWLSESDLMLYINSMYDKNIWGHKQDPNRPPFKNRGSHLAYAEAYSDNATDARNSTINVRLTDAYSVPLNDDYNGWSWSEIRRINYFLTNYQKADIPDSKKKALAAEVYFFKAWDYYRKVQLFGDVPWLTENLNIDSPELYKPRDSREVVMDSVLMCINRAIGWLPKVSKAAPCGRINKDMAQFLKARICLYEGTYRKYHKELGLESSANTWLNECLSACDYLMSGKRYTLYNNGKKDSYWSLFAIKDADIRNMPEAVLGVEYSSELGVTHDLPRYYQQNNHMGLCAQKSLVDDYLCEDGRPIYIGGSDGSYVNNPLFKGYGKWTELDNRDPRMTQTIVRPGEYASIYNYSTGVYDAAINGVEFPRLGGYEESGYRFSKHWMPDLQYYQAASNAAQAAIEFRYAEVLLNYAEAKAELGTITDSDIDMTINELRKRAGFDFTKYPTAKLSLSAIPADPRLDALYAEKLDYPVSPLIREIRRERRVEMVLEDLRYWDLMRWKAGPLLTVPMRGMLFSTEIEKIYDGSYLNGVINPETGLKERAAKAVLNKEVYIDDDRFIILKPQSTNMSNGILPWSDYRYYWPIPKSQLNFPNTQLKQTPGWENK